MTDSVDDMGDKPTASQPVGRPGAMEPPPEPLERRDYDAATLMRQHAPVLRNPNKQVVYRIACPDGTVAGHVSYSRWAEMPLPATADPGAAASLLDVRDGFFDYEPVAAPAPAAATVEWHVNFADPNLFFAYGWSMFAQDEIQAAEHPVLGSLREALVAEGRPTRTVEGGRPTPVLVMGAERRVSIQTDRRAERGGPSWLYGIAFAEAEPETVRRATVRIDPPTISNIIAIAAPVGGYGRYRKEEIELALSTAYSGFRAAVLESRRAAGPTARVIVHSGFWGCGAFGGNRVMMTLLQLLEAEMAGLDGLVLHVGEPAGRASVEQATTILRDGLAAAGATDTAELIGRIASLGLEWGHSDRN
jgi:hypothetical protein